MTKTYIVRLVRDLREWTTVEVEAATPEQAEDRALAKAEIDVPKLTWTTSESSRGEPYAVDVQEKHS